MGIYFVEEHWKPRIIYYFAQTDEWRESEKGLSEAAFISQAIGKIVKGVLFTHRTWRWGTPVDDLIAESMFDVWRALPKFDPTFINSKGKKATMFSYISIIAKRSMRFNTIRDKKWRDLSTRQDFDEVRELNRPVHNAGYKNWIKDEEGYQKFQVELFKRLDRHCSINKRNKIKSVYVELMRILPELSSIGTQATLSKEIRINLNIQTTYIRFLFTEMTEMWPNWGYLLEPILSA